MIPHPPTLPLHPHTTNETNEMNTKLPLAALLAASALLLAPGCQSPVTSGAATHVAVDGDRILEASLQIDDRGLARHVSLVGATTQMLPNGMLRVQARLASTDRRDFKVQCRYRWFDAAGFEVETGGGAPWVPIVLHGGEDVPVSGVAPRPDVSAFAISVRRL